MTRPYQAGKVADVPVIVSTVNDEGAEPEGRSNKTLSTTNDQVWNLKDAQNATFGSASPDNCFLNHFKAYI